jgi:hypothetical protein
MLKVFNFQADIANSKMLRMKDVFPRKTQKARTGATVFDFIGRVPRF